MHGVGGDRGQAEVGRHPREEVVPGAVTGKTVVGQLHEHAFPAVQVDELAQPRERGRGPFPFQRPAHRALAAAGEHHAVLAGVLHDLVEAVDRPPLLGALGELAVGDRPAQPVVAVLAEGEQQQVLALRVRDPVLRRGEPDAQLRAEHRAHAELLGRLGEPHHPVHAVVVGQRDGVQPELVRRLHQLLRVARAVQEAEVGVGVQLRVRRAGLGGAQLVDAQPELGRRGVPVAVVRPRRAVTAVPLVRLARQRAFEVRPADRRVVPPHQNSSSGARLGNGISTGGGVHPNHAR